MKKLKLAIMGCGSIGRGVASFVRKEMKEIEITCLYDQKPKQALRLKQDLSLQAKVARSAREFIEGGEYLLEAASQKAAAYLIRHASSRRKLIVVSSGVFLSQPGLLRKVVSSDFPVYVPSGAVAGIDGIKAHAACGIKKIEIVTSKPPSGLGRKAQGVVFEGEASEAVKIFPKNINVASTLQLAAQAGVRVKVRVEPRLKANVHYVKLASSLGRLKVKVENFPSQNPRTSQLTIYSVAALLRRLVSPLKLGS